MSHPAVNYRPDIDGLRAVAVLLVVLYHAQIGLFPGGYIGVDVFFVISGYLITGIIAGEMREGRFSIVSFYERRARRILPALLTVILATIIVGYLVLVPTDLLLLSKSIAPAILFYANNFMKAQVGYFGPEAESIPLLHLWSLAVEEQFYLVYPLVLFIVMKIFRKWTPLVAAAALIWLFVLACLHHNSNPVTSFFLTVDRLWELLLGATMRLGERHLKLPARSAIPAQILGLVAIIGTAILQDDSADIPTFGSLAPCLGAALVVIALNGHEKQWSPLGTDPMRFVGRMSYSLYLWHWPILVFAGYVMGPSLGPEARLALVAAAMILSYLSLVVIEDPFRRTRDGRPIWVLALSVAAAAGLALSAAQFGKTTGGLAFRLSGQIEELRIARAEVKRRVDAACVKDWPAATVAPCPVSQSNSPPQIVLLGDSHTDALVPAFAAYERTFHVPVAIDWGGSCAPLTGLKQLSYGLRRGKFSTACLRWSNMLPDYISAQGSPNILVFGAHWNGYTNKDLHADTAVYGQEEYSALRTTTTALIDFALQKGKRVLLLGPAPDYQTDIAREFERMAFGRNARTSVPLADFLEENKVILAWLKTQETRPGVVVVYQHKALCTETECVAIKDGKPLYIDKHHLSIQGAMIVAPLIEAALNSLRADAPISPVQPAAAQ